MPRFRFLTLTGAALLLAGSLVPARAQADAEDAKRGVARISLMDGDVTVRRGDSGDWVAGVVNAPLMTGDQIATASNSRAEIEMDSANVLRLSGDASIRIAELEYDHFQFQLARGTMVYRVLRPTNANIEVDTPSLAVRPSKEGVYRIHVDEQGVSEVTVRLGSVEVSAASGSQWINANQTLLARGSSDDPEFKVTDAIAMDDFDHWNESRDQAELSSVSAQYVPPGVYGSEDLDQYGTWSEVPDYGYVWQPYEPVGWSPYSMGQWSWLDWYGWTWVPYERWGWAPYHYGRWFFRSGFGWAWYPGARFTMHYWSPALVGFIGWGGAGFGLGYVGWVPLAPFEVFHPWWGPGFYGRFGYMSRSIGISAVSVAGVYRNAAVLNGINGVRGADFQSGRFGSIGHFSGSQITDARIANGAVPIAPSPANLRYSARTVASAPRAVGNTKFFSREQPSPARQIPFSQQQSGFESARSNAANRAATPQPGQPASRPGANMQARPSAQGAPNTNSGWRQAGDRPAQSQQAETPARSGSEPQPNNPQRTSEQPAQASGWQRFGASGTEQEYTGAGRPANNDQRPATQSGSNWNRFGSSGNAAQTYRAPEPAPQTYRAPQPAPQQTYRAPQSAPAPSYHAPSYSAPSRPSGGGGGGGGHTGGGGGGGGSHGGGGHR
jgi:hypothetical protein